MDADVEKKRGPSPEDGSSSPIHGQVITAHHNAPIYTRIIDSFRQNPHAHVVVVAIDDDGKPLVDQPPSQPALAMKLKQRHLQMIAIGGSIGKQTLPSPQVKSFPTCLENQIDDVPTRHKIFFMVARNRLTDSTALQARACSLALDLHFRPVGPQHWSSRTVH